MSTLVRLVRGGDSEYESDEVFVSIESIPVVLADLRRCLPSLQKELKKKWPVKHVEIQEKRPRRKNPYDPSQIVAPVAIGLAITFSYAAAKAAGTKVGDGLGEEITERVRKWLLGKPKVKRHKRHKTKTK
jgi:hypothetical protein